MKKFILACMTPVMLLGQIYKVKAMEEAKTYFDTLTEQDIAVFDIDDVLITPSHPAFQLKNMQQCWPFLKELALELGEDKAGFFAYSAIISEPELVESVTPYLIQDLQERKIKTLALTANFCGKFAHIEDFYTYKLGKLKALGIEFPDGAIFTGKASKGQCLISFLKEAQITPRRVLFVDDRIDNLLDAEEAIKQYGKEIEFIGLEYTGSIERQGLVIATEEIEHNWQKLAKEWKKIAFFATLEKAFLEAETGTWVLLDLGGTLIYNSEAIMQTEHEAWRKAWFQKNFPQLSREESLDLVRIVESHKNSWSLIDSCWPSLIKVAQAKGLKVMALTKVIRHSSLKGLRAAKLAEVGIFFNDEIPTLGQGQSYGYDHGIIETEAPLKGPVLLEVLSQINQNPKHVIFVDDRAEQVESVLAACQKKGIPISAFHYKYQKSLPLDETFADQQLKTLVLEKKWITQNTNG